MENTDQQKQQAKERKVWFGIDYGSKLSGNTVIGIYNEGKIFFMEVEEGIDADRFILCATEHFKPEWIFLDAPLSLPGIYSKLEGCEDYNFREADRELKAMSPMFLGGLTARAISLKDTIEKNWDIPVFETYPRQRARLLHLEDCGYKREKAALNQCRNKIVEKLWPGTLIDCSDIKTWHHVDALLALTSAMEHFKGNTRHYGNSKEGLITV